MEDRKAQHELISRDSRVYTVEGSQEGAPRINFEGCWGVEDTDTSAVLARGWAWVKETVRRVELGVSGRCGCINVGLVGFLCGTRTNLCLGNCI